VIRVRQKNHLSESHCIYFKEPIAGYQGKVPESYSEKDEQMYITKLERVVRTQIQLHPPWCFYHCVGKGSKLCKIDRFPGDTKGKFDISVEGGCGSIQARTVHAAMKTPTVPRGYAIPWNFNVKYYFAEIYLIFSELSKQRDQSDQHDQPVMPENTDNSLESDTEDTVRSSVGQSETEDHLIATPDHSARGTIATPGCSNWEEPGRPSTGGG
jgi:hypothetical protein